MAAMAAMFPRLPTCTTLLTSLACASLLFHLAVGVSCPVTESPVLEAKVAGSEVVVQGQVKRQVKADPGDTSYTAEVEVQCVFKGGPVASVINVLESGRKEGRCIQTELVQGRVYLIYLRPEREAGAGSNNYSPVFPQDPAEKKYLDELRYSCNLNVQLPTGIPGNEFCDQKEFVLDYDCEDTTTTMSASTANAIMAATAPLLFVTCWLPVLCLI